MIARTKCGHFGSIFVGHKLLQFFDRALDSISIAEERLEVLTIPDVHFHAATLVALGFPFTFCFATIQMRRLSRLKRMSMMSLGRSDAQIWPDVMRTGGCNGPIFLFAFGEL